MHHIQLSIPEPCHENWNNMTATEQGRYCNACAKTVVDFSSMTDVALANYFLNLKNEKVCGRVHPDQLNRAVPVPLKAKRSIFGYWKFLVAGFLYLTRCQTGYTQGKVLIRQEKVCTSKEPEVRSLIGDTIYQSTRKPLAVRITDTNDTPIVHASITNKRTDEYRMADTKGSVSLEGFHSNDSLHINAIGFVQKTFTLQNLMADSIALIADVRELEPVEISAYTSEDIKGLYLGGLTVRTTTTRSVSDTIKDLFSPAIQFNCFPNPAARGGQVTITYRTGKPVLFTVVITTMQGQPIFQQKFSAPASNIQQQLPLQASWPAGTYLITLLDEKKKKLATEKLIIQ